MAFIMAFAAVDNYNAFYVFYWIVDYVHMMSEEKDVGSSIIYSDFML